MVYELYEGHEGKALSSPYYYRYRDPEIDLPNRA
jgi:hypothetical protein